MKQLVISILEELKLLDLFLEVQKTCLELNILAYIICGVIFLLILFLKVSSLYDKSRYLSAVVYLVGGELILGTPFMLKLIFKLGGWDYFFHSNWYGYMIYSTIVLALSVVANKCFYNESLELMEIISPVIGDFMLGAPFLVKIFSPDIIKLYEYCKKNKDILKDLLLVLFTLAVFIVVIIIVRKVIYNIRYKLLVKRVVLCMNNHASYISANELKNMLKRKFNSSSNKKMGINTIIEISVNNLVKNNVCKINSDTQRIISELGMIEYRELFNQLSEKFRILCVDDLSSAIYDAININGEMINLESLTLVKCPGATSGKTYEKNEIKVN